MCANGQEAFSTASAIPLLEMVRGHADFPALAEALRRQGVSDHRARTRLKEQLAEAFAHPSVPL